MERYSVPTAAQGQGRAARAQLVEPGLEEAKRQGTSNYAEKEKCHEDAARGRFSALLAGSLTHIAPHLNTG